MHCAALGSIALHLIRRPGLSIRLVLFLGGRQDVGRRLISGMSGPCTIGPTVAWPPRKYGGRPPVIEVVCMILIATLQITGMA